MQIRDKVSELNQLQNAMLPNASVYVQCIGELCCCVNMHVCENAHVYRGGQKTVIPQDLSTLF